VRGSVQQGFKGVDCLVEQLQVNTSLFVAFCSCTELFPRFLGVCAPKSAGMLRRTVLNPCRNSRYM
jgi:hypothetical protein